MRHWFQHGWEIDNLHVDVESLVVGPTTSSWSQHANGKTRCRHLEQRTNCSILPYLTIWGLRTLCFWRRSDDVLNFLSNSAFVVLHAGRRKTYRVLWFVMQLYVRHCSIYMTSQRQFVFSEHFTTYFNVIHCLKVVFKIATITCETILVCCS